MNDAVGHVKAGGDRRREDGHLDAGAAGQMRNAALRQIPYLGALAEVHQHARRLRVEPEVAGGVLTAEQVFVVAEDDRRNPVRRVAALSRRPAVLAVRELPRLQHGVEEGLTRQRAAVRPRLPHRAPAPHPLRPARRRQRVDQALIGMRPVEDDHVRGGLREGRAQAAAQAPRPAPIAAGAGGGIRGHVLDREPLVADDRRRPRERQEQRIEALEAACDRHRAREVPKPGAVGRHEQDATGAVGRRALIRSRSYASSSGPAT